MKINANKLAQRAEEIQKRKIRGVPSQMTEDIFQTTKSLLDKGFFYTTIFETLKEQGIIHYKCVATFRVAYLGWKKSRAN
jgi:hypothetical protein